MNLREALMCIVTDRNCPAVNYAVNYAAVALAMVSEKEDVDGELKTQLLYVLNNISAWRGGTKTSKLTKEQVKEARQVIKKAAGWK